MNLLMLAPTWLAAMAMVALAFAVLEDAWRMRIANLTSGAMALMAIVAALVAGPEWGLWQNLLLMVAVLAVGTMLFASGAMGGGDVKLLAACALWLDLSAGWKMLVAVAIAGGLETLIVIIMRLVGWPESWTRNVALLRRKEGIPYAIAIAGGMGLMLAWVRA